MKSEMKTPTNPADRLAEKIKRNMTGRAARPINLRCKLTGPAADNWRAIQDAADGLGYDDATLLSILLMYGSSLVRSALKKMPRQ